MRARMLVTFSTQFINTGILILLINSNFSEQKIPIFSQVFTSGVYKDFTMDWYNDVGQSIMVTMLTTTFMPFVEFGISVRIEV
jgi:hypothetical protein